MKRTAAALIFLLLTAAPSSILAAKADPCAALPPASSTGFEPLLEKYMNAFCYQKQAWNHDAQIRTSDGVHPYVKVWYSPSLWNWLTVSNRQGDVPDGAMLVKEQYASLTAALHEWTIMVKDSTGSWDGWYWADLSAPTKAQKTTPPCAEPQTSFVGFGLYCINCHASALATQGTYATTEHVNDLPPMLTGNEPEILDNIHQLFPRLASSIPIEQSLAPRDTAIPSEIFGKVKMLPLPKSACMPSEALDHVVSGGKATGPEEFLTSDQCAACHNATGTLSGTNRVDLPSMLWPDSVTPIANLSEYGEWRYSMMGLAGRDPVFFSQLNSESTLHANIQNQGPNPVGFVQNLCLHCHGVMGQRQNQIDNGPNALFMRAQLNQTDSKYGALGRDGVSCTICHHVTAEGFGDINQQATTNTTFSGNFNVGPPTEVYAQYDPVATYPMLSALGVTPMVTPDSATGDPRLCGSCHTIILPVYDKNGNQVMENGKPKTFYEQATFPEWLNSAFAEVPCTECHMPSEFHENPRDSIQTLSYKIANIEDNTFPPVPFREPDSLITMDVQPLFERHLLMGINTFALEMFKQFRAQLGLYAQDPNLPGKFASVISGQNTAISESVDIATTQTATVQILSATRTNGTLTADVLVRNLAGHSFPSGVGFRRAFVNFQVLDSSGKELWASGDTSPEGVILGDQRKPLVTEFFSPAQQTFQTHFWKSNPITDQNQVQIYEELVTDPQNQLTTSFISLNQKMKDNRLQPQGWSTAGPFAEETGPVGEAANDPDYTTTNSSGSNTVEYQVPLAAKVANAAVVRATLYYQSIPPYFLRMRAEDAKGVDTQRLQFYARNLKVKGTPVDGWRLQIATDSSNVQ